MDNCAKAIKEFNTRSPDTALRQKQIQRKGGGQAFSLRGFLILPRDRMQNLKEEEISSPNFGGEGLGTKKGIMS